MREKIISRFNETYGSVPELLILLALLKNQAKKDSEPYKY